MAALPRGRIRRSRMSEDKPFKPSQRRVLLVAALLLLLYSAWQHWGQERPRPRAPAPQPVERVQMPALQGGVAQPPAGIPAGGAAEEK